VTVVFTDQKNSEKMDSRTQRRMGDPWLYPVRCWASVVSRIRRTMPDYDKSTTVNCNLSGKQILLISNTFVRTLLRSFCASHGGKAVFGFAPHEIGNKSLRSGAAMALFLANHSTAKILILGRWLSDAFRRSSDGRTTYPST
jgi:hypothetical protein